MSSLLLPSRIQIPIYCPDVSIPTKPLNVYLSGSFFFLYNWAGKNNNFAVISCNDGASNLCRFASIFFPPLWKCVCARLGGNLQSPMSCYIPIKLIIHPICQTKKVTRSKQKQKNTTANFCLLLPFCRVCVK